ncbi:MAG: hypothetical protein B7X93_04565 [Hydrogenophilales bacterium 17-61-9]|nr:MAG: hypothetical protein B7X93_04565 [Hydrogenophilales bacterium 17-61-9]
MLLLWASSTLAGARTLYSDDGLSEISVPGERWLVRPHVGRAAALRVTDTQGDSVLVVNTYLPDELEPMPLDKLSRKLSTRLLDDLRDGRISPARKLTLHGRPAVEHEISGFDGDARFTYLSTVVEGKSAKHHLIAWMPEASYKAKPNLLREVFSSFRESAKPRPARERIDLEFNWPHRGEAKISYASKRVKRDDVLEMQGGGTITWRPLGENEVLISTRATDFKMTSNDKKKDQKKEDYMQNLLQQAMTQIPDYVVSTGGDFIRIENMGPYYERFEKAMLEGLSGDSDEAQAKAKQLMKRLISEEGLRASLEDDWNSNVYNWTGGSYLPGETYTYFTQYQAAALGDTQFPMTLTQQLTGRVACHANDEKQSCVRLVHTTRVSGPGFTQAMHQFVVKTVQDMAGVDGKDIKLSIDSAEVVKTLTLIVDPETMMPYEENKSSVTTTVISESGHSQTAQDINETSTRYTY